MLFIHCAISTRTRFGSCCYRKTLHFTLLHVSRLRHHPAMDYFRISARSIMFYCSLTSSPAAPTQIWPIFVLHKACISISQGALCCPPRGWHPFQCEGRGSASGCKHLPEASGVGLQLQYLRIHPQNITSTLTFCQSRGWGSRMQPACRDPHLEREECGSVPYTVATSDLLQEALTWTSLTTCLVFSLCLCIVLLLSFSYTIKDHIQIPALCI